MMVRYPGTASGEGTADAPREQASDPARDTVARPARLPLHTPPPLPIPASDTLRLGCLARPAIAAVLREALALAFPRALLMSEWTMGVPDVRVLVVDAGPRAATGIDTVRDLRAQGYTGGVVLVHAEPLDAAAGERVARLGVGGLVALEDVARSLGSAVAGTLGDPAVDPVSARAWASLRRTQQLVAAGEVASGLQHALANPLTALLAEAQLLEMEPLSPAVHDAVGRIVTQCRRTIAVAKRLDGLA